jgi:histidyl-tRNA synthetase
MSSLIEPRTLSGFRDFPPALMIPRERLIETARRVYRSYGFAPIDTPALEYTEILLGKGGQETDKQLYRFTDHGGRDVALRFDLTVPFARFAAQYIGQLGMPFKRYHIGTVWRGERPQKGRYREFMQCDFDTIGTTSNAADIEVALVIHDLMKALGFERSVLRINNRMVLNGLIEELGLAGQTKSVLIALDKLPKVGREAVLAEMAEHGVGAEPAGRVLEMATTQGSNEEVLGRLERDFGRNATAAEGVRRLRELLAVARTAGVPDRFIQIDVAIARGLDYYTGTIYETFLLDKPEIGSVCSGGRYDNLASLYTKQQLPGVGASLGLDRLLAAMEDLKLLDRVSTPAPVLVVQFDAARLGDYQRIARILRAEDIGAEVYPEATRRIGKQFDYANDRGFRIVLIAGGDEFAKGEWKVKDMKGSRENPIELVVKEADLLKEIKKLLGVNVH